MELTVDGHKVFAATGGRPFDPELPAIIFVHGAGCDHTVWALQVRYFAHHGRGVLAIDLPGHGLSEGPPLATLDDIAEWIFRLQDAAGVREAALVGHSLGATIVLAAAGKHPDRVRALAAVGIGEMAPVNSGLLGAAKANDHLGMDLIVGWGHGRRAHVGGNRLPGIWMIGNGVRMMERSGDQVLYTDLASTEGYQGFDELVRNIACPTLFVLGADDMMTPTKGARRLAGEIKDIRVVTLPYTGHMIMAERPEELLDSLREIV